MQYQVPVLDQLLLKLMDFGASANLGGLHCLFLLNRLARPQRSTNC